VRIGTWSGSLGEGSANTAALAVACDALERRGVEAVAIEGLGDIPPFRAQLADDAPAAVVSFRASLDATDGILVAAPEYAGGLAGVAKNALDWLVGSGSLHHRVVGVLSAGTTGGPFAIEQLVRTISWQGGFVVATLGIDAPRTKQDATGAISDPATVAAIGAWAGAVVDAVADGPAARLARVAPIVTPFGIDVARFGVSG
jgi:chromate reductase, NAD(P)H dehydrogenase (quinone)